jgi:riboflavin kinase/FMN adenylyltransferase
MQVHVVEELEVVISSLHIVEVRSSLIRWLLAHGRARDAALCLGRPYALRGPVIKGFQRGRQLGMPTANIDCSDQLIPADGVYAGRCTIAGRTYPAGISIGTLPTFNEVTRQVEGHLLGFDGDLYGQTIEFELTDFLREQIKFFDVEQLKTRMWRDMDQCRELATVDPIRPPLSRLSA